MLRDGQHNSSTPVRVNYHKVFLMMHQAVFTCVIKIKFTIYYSDIAALSLPQYMVPSPALFYVNLPRSSTVLNPTPMNQLNSSNPQGEVSLLIMLSKLPQYGINRCVSFVLLFDRWSSSSMISIQALFVARRQERISDRVKRIKNPTWWARCILFICCVPVTPDTGDHQTRSNTWTDSFHLCIEFFVLLIISSTNNHHASHRTLQFVWSLHILRMHSLWFRYLSSQACMLGQIL